MFKPATQILSLLFISTLWSCGASSTKEHVEPAPQREEFNLRSIHKLTRQGPECQLEDALPALSEKTAIWMYQANRPTKITVDMHEFSGQGITSSHIAGVKTGIKGWENGNMIHYQFEGELLPICYPGGYEIDSLENIGLALAYAAHTTIVQNLPIHPQAHRKTLQIQQLPEIQTQFLTPIGIFQSTRKNNVQWIRNHLEKVIFYPHDELFLRQNPPPHYHNWTVLGHELTHIVFHNLVLSPKSISMSPQLTLAVSVLNEGIADLVGTRHWHSFGLHSLCNDRDINLGVCKQGKVKRIDKQAIHVLFASLDSDIYVMGESYAYGFGRLLQQAQTPAAPDLEQIRTVFSYLQSLQQESWPIEGEEFLHFAVKVFLETSLKEQPQLLPTQCQTIQQVFPVFAEAYATQLISWGCSP